MIVAKKVYFVPYWEHIEDTDGFQLEMLVLHSLGFHHRIMLLESYLFIKQGLSPGCTLRSGLDLLSSNTAPLAKAFLPAPSFIQGTADVKVILVFHER